MAKLFKFTAIAVFIAFVTAVVILLSELVEVDERIPATPSEHSTPTPTTTPRIDNNGNRFITKIEINTLESFPVQITATVSGIFPNGCYKVGDIKKDRVNNQFTLDLNIKGYLDELCTQALVPFETSVNLDVYGLPAGEYSVQAGDVTQKFTLGTDNILPSTEE